MNILKRQLALLLVLAMTLTMLPMPTHADEVTDPESPSAIVEESTEKPTVSKDEVSTDAAKKPVEKAESDTAAKEDAAPAVETTVDTAVNSNTTTTDELIPDVSEDTPASDPVEKPEAATDADDTAEDAEVEENTESGSTVESEEDSTAADNIESDIPEASKTDTQEGTDQVEPETDVLVAATFSRSVANAVADECEHPETEVAWDTKDQVINCKPISDTQHQISGYQYHYCTSCYERVGESFAVTEVGNHELDANGRCGMCGYSSNSGCTHAVTATAWDDGYPIRYSQYSLTQHEASGYKYTYCTSCSEKIDNSFAVTTYENHSLDADGNCGFCGYGSGCNHSNTKTVWDYLQTSYVQYSSTHHKASGYQYTYCTDCSLRLGDSVYKEGLEEHTTGGYWCVCCHYKASDCDHANTETRWDTDVSSTYTPYSDTQHKREGYQYIYCIDCSVQITNGTLAEVLENHTQNDNGTCEKCWYSDGCEHSIIWQRGSVYKCGVNDDVQHRATYRMNPYCTKCKQIVGDWERSEEIVEDHIFGDNNWCDVCGYTRNCTHERTRVVTEYGTNGLLYPYFKKVSDTQHVACVYEYDVCQDCTAQISEKRIVETPFYSDHEMDARGMCKYCEACTHETKITDWDPNQLTRPSFVPLNNSRHIARGYKYTYCAACLEQFGSDFWVDELENHTPDSEGKCTFCGYTATGTEELTVMAVAHGQDVDQGIKITVTANVSGGSGSYQYGWKVLVDGVVKHETDMSMGASYEYTVADGEEGTYSFIVTVKDSEGNTATDKSAAFIIGHTCDYETVTSTQLVNQSLTHHTVETTTYEECTICHEKRNEVTDVQWVEHTPIDAESYGHEAAHPHKKYFICECGAHPYLDGEYHTANGEVQDESVCCICHDHQYGAEEETDEGTRQKTCANCGITTVTHTHDYKLVETTKLVSQSETHHTVETTTYEECTSCHEKRNEATNKEWVEHTPMNKDAYGYEASHDNYHQKYFICECGAHPYIEGEYKTANGKVQEKSVCCICNGHKYGEAKEAADGTWKKTCANCGVSQKVAAPVQPTEPEEEKHIHRVSTTGKAAYEHPHQYDILCVCGEVMGSDTLPMYDCCQCIGHHNWGSTVRLPDNSFKQLCSYCGASRTVTPSSKDKNLYKVIDSITYRHNVAKDYQEDYLKEHGIDNHGTNVWKTIASQATEQLLDVDFVTTAETIDTIQKGLLGIAWDGLTYKDWDEQQTETWKTLLLKMLEAELENELEEGMDIFEEANGLTSNTVKVLENVYKDKKEYFQKLNGQLDANLDVLSEKIDQYADADPNSNALSSVMMDNLQDLQESMAERSEVAKNNTAKSSDAEEFWKGLGWVLKFAESALDGMEHAYVANNYRNALTALNQSAENITILEGISKTAAEAGNNNLADAADELREDILDSMPEMVNGVVSATEGVLVFVVQYFGWGFNELAKEAFTGALKVVSDGISNTMDILTLGATAMDLALGWGPVYDEAQLLMTYNMMDITMDITDVLKNVDATEAENAHYMTKLWGVLQTEGCLSAQKFLDAYDSARKLDIEALGFDNDKELSNALGLLKSEHNYFVTALSLPLEKIN